MNIAVTKNDVEDCHRLGKSSRSTIVWFVNRKHYYVILSKKFSLNQSQNLKDRELS